MATGSVIGALRVNLGLDSANFTRGAGKATNSMTRLQRNMQRASAGIARAGRAMAIGIAAIGTAAIAGAIAGSRQLQELGNQARVAGETAQDFKILSLAAKGLGIEQDKLSDILKDVNDKFGDFAATGQGPLKDFFENIAPQVGITQEAFEGLSASNALQLYVSSLEKANVSQAEMTFYMEAIASDATALLPLFQNNGKAISDMAVKASELGLALDDDMIAAASRARSEFGVVADVLKTRLSAELVNLMPTITNLAEALIPALISAMNAIIPILDAVAALLRGDFKLAWQEIKPIVAAAADGIFNILNGLADRAAQAIKDMASAILAEIKQIAVDALEAAKEIGNNIIKGITDALSLGGRETVGSATRKMTRAGIDAAKDELETQSPSRVFMRLGEYMSEGMAIGVGNRASDVSQAVVEMSRAAEEATRQINLTSFGDELVSNLSQIRSLSDAWDAVKQSAISAIQSMSDGLMRSGLSNLLGAGGLFGNLFAGFFDKGGSIPSGKFGIAGENGMELVRGPAHVTSTRDTANLMRGNQGNVYNIDARGAQEGVADQIVKAIQQATPGIQAGAQQRTLKYMSETTTGWG